MNEHLISWGAGINSTAIIALYLLGKLKGKPEIVFADTGCEYPETYNYIKKIKNQLEKKGWRIKILSSVNHPELYAKRCRGLSLCAYLWKHKTVPSFKWRYCNAEYKREPIRRYANGRKLMIGICADELHRIKNNIYPVKSYTRKECEEIISQAGLPPAHKTGCFICPLQPKAHWINLYKYHPDLWRRAVKLEKNSSGITFIQGFTIEEKMEKWIKIEEKLRFTQRERKKK